MKQQHGRQAIAHAARLPSIYDPLHFLRPKNAKVLSQRAKGCEKFGFWKQLLHKSERMVLVVAHPRLFARRRHIMRLNIQAITN
jgi:hypothetical protein